jgi:hypothetical protein
MLHHVQLEVDITGARLQQGLGFENLPIKSLDLQTPECICPSKISLLFLARQ